ncbi:hypothetical protein [Rhodoflexus caldus]|uniref:hypothetical protein n=1 Tax=Rhodoflexus caldus TaxID=2891236 RepID=UPI00202A734C|nr:hypothetical protein [Rhodoflexus caldus]
MSLIHYIIYKRPLDISRLDEFVSTIKGATYEDRGEGVFYFWIDGKSTRGFDITLEQDYIEVRNTILSNKHDYDLTNKIIAEIIALTDGIIIDEDEEQISDFPIFDNYRIAEAEIHDCETIQALSREHEDIAIYGPVRKVHFGKRLHEQFKGLKGEQLKNKMFEIILTVNYQIPNFDYGNIMQVGNSEDDKKIVKLLTNETDYIIDKYDYILLHTSDEQPIMITNDILNKMLPSNWKLVDEFTVVAPMTDENEWNKLLTNAKKFNLWHEFANK